MSGAVPAAIAVVTFGRRSPVEVPPELACTTIFGCEALKELTRRCITCDVGGVCACQNWMVTVPVGLPEGEAGLDPEHPATTTARAAIPARAVRFIVALLGWSTLAGRSSLDGSGDRLHEPALTEKEDEQNRRRRQDVFFFQAEDGIRVATVTGVQTCALPI